MRTVINKKRQAIAVNATRQAPTCLLEVICKVSTPKAYESIGNFAEISTDRISKCKNNKTGKFSRRFILTLRELASFRDNVIANYENLLTELK